MYITFSFKKAVWGIIFSIVGLSIGVLLKFSPSFLTSASSPELVIIIDAGHGTPDGGAVGINGTIEEEINLKIAKKLNEVLIGKGIKTIMTRTTNNSLSILNADIAKMKKEDMNKRLNIMKNSNADLFVSIHMNFFKGASVNGLRIFYSANHEKIKPLAENIQSKMSEITGAKTTAVKSADRSLFLMKNPPIPAILVECGFLSNAEEEKKLNDEDYQSRLAWAIASAIEKYYIE